MMRAVVRSKLLVLQHNCRDTDATIAEKVMGITVLRATGSQWASEDKCRMEVGEPYFMFFDERCPNKNDPDCIAAWTFVHRVPAYSTDMTAAWLVINAFRTNSKLAVLFPDFINELKKQRTGDWKTFEGWFFGEAEAPVAICMSALKTLDIVNK